MFTINRAPACRPPRNPGPGHPPCPAPPPVGIAFACPSNINPYPPLRRVNQAIKAKTPVIVHDQGKSRHPQKKPGPLGTSLEHGDWNCELSRPIPFAPLRLCAFALKIRHQGSIKAKTPAIKANQASSRQTPFFQTAEDAPQCPTNKRPGTWLQFRWQSW